MQNININLQSAKALLDKKQFYVSGTFILETTQITISGVGCSIYDAINNAYDNAQMWAELMIENVNS